MRSFMILSPGLGAFSDLYKVFCAFRERHPKILANRMTESFIYSDLIKVAFYGNGSRKSLLKKCLYDFIGLYNLCASIWLL